MRFTFFILLFLFVSPGFAQTDIHTVRSGDTLTDYYANGCVWATGVWKAYRNGCGYGYVGQYKWYYETKCGQLKREFMYDENGRMLYDRGFAENGDTTRNYIAPKAEAKKDSCQYYVSDYFCPDCMQDTAMEGWFVYPLDQNSCECRIDSIHVIVHDTSGNRIIYSSDEIWSGIKKHPLNADDPYSRCYYPSGSYPFELTIFSHGGESYHRNGKISLVIADARDVCK
ncbi:MAG TPA: hypothetical protein VL651_13155 [Bacteroidia bacterium]|jgi:hypothetical protein|nr:hypothetical protein [Bacteroidia bacterium]